MLEHVPPRRSSSLPPSIELQWRASERSRYGLIAACAIIAVVSGRVAMNIGQESSWSALADHLGLMVAALVVAAGVLRVIDLFAQRGMTAAEADRSALLSHEIRSILALKHPEVRAAAAMIDARSLFETPSKDQPEKG